MTNKDNPGKIEKRTTAFNERKRIKNAGVRKNKSAEEKKRTKNRRTLNTSALPNQAMQPTGAASPYQLFLEINLGIRDPLVFSPVMIPMCRCCANKVGSAGDRALKID